MTNAPMTREEILATAKVGGYAIVRMMIDDVYGSRPEDDPILCIKTWYGGCEVETTNIISIEPPPQTPEQRIAELGVQVAQLLADSWRDASGCGPAKHFDGAKPDANKPSGRIEWGGGKCPVAADVIVKAWCKDGRVIECRAGDLLWSNKFVANNIVAYEVIP